jgi:hypothetical protein
VGISGCCAGFTGTSRTVAFGVTRTVEVTKVTVGLVSATAFPLVDELLDATSTATLTTLADRSLYCLVCQVEHLGSTRLLV